MYCMYSVWYVQFVFGGILLTKEKRVNFRISEEEYKNIKDVYGKFSNWYHHYYEIFELETPTLLQQKADSLQDLYIQCTYKLKAFNDKKTQKQQTVLQKKESKVFEKLKTSHNPDYFVGKEIEGIKVTKEMVNKVKGKYDS